jgi:(p)ppGpp synthase/HD superfamily hydrolase
MFMEKDEALRVADTLQPELADLAYGMAVRLHGETGQTYDGVPYAETHCVGVRDVLAEFGFTSTFWRIVAMLHDVPEDTMADKTPEQRFDYLVDHFGELVANVVWTVSGFGPNRKARNADIKAKIIGDTTRLSPILKCADRIYNARHSIEGAGHWKMYRDEMADFESYIRPHVPEEMWNTLAGLF